MNDRTYKIQFNEYYFVTGKSDDGKQFLISGDFQGMMCLAFSPEGEYLGQEIRPLQNPDHFTKECLDWLAELDASPATIEIKPFYLDGQYIGIKNLPDFLEEFIADPASYDEDQQESLPKVLADWRANKQFVFQWHEEYWMFENGEIEST